MTTPMSTEVDVAGWLCRNLPPLLPGVGMGTDTPPNLETVLPFLRPVRAGGGSDEYAVLDNPRMVLHCFADTNHAATVLAGLAFSAVRSLRGQVRDGFVITRARKNSGPILLPYGNPAEVRQAVVTVELQIKVAY